MSSSNHDLVQRVACYVRVSHEEQKLKGLSPNAQREVLKAFAEKNNLKIVEWYEDLGVSGRKLIKKRPALQQMIKDAEEGHFERIIFIKLDRYFRSIAEYYECQKRLDLKNVKWTATEEKYDLSTANGRAFVNMKLTIAELEADQTGERIDLVNEYKVKTGQPLCGSQSLGVAYSVRKNEEGIKKVVKDPATKEIVTDYLNHFLTHRNKRQAYIYIKDKYNSNLSYRSLSKILVDTKIYGYYRGNPNYCEPYIDKETFDKIQEFSKTNIRDTSAKRVYLFTGLIRCPDCNRILSGRFTGNTSKVNKITGKKYSYEVSYYHYRCYNHYANAICDYSKAMNETHIENWLLKYFDKYVNEYIEAIKIEDIRKKDNFVNDKIKQLKSEMTRLNNMYQKSRITEEKYDHDYEDLENQLVELEKQLEPFVERDLKLYEELLKSDWKTLYNALNRENKRSFWHKYIKQIVIDDNKNIEKVIFF